MVPGPASCGAPTSTRAFPRDHGAHRRPSRSHRSRVWTDVLGTVVLLGVLITAERVSAEPAIPTATQQAEYNGNSRFGTTGSSVFAASPARSILAPATSEPLASEWQRGFHSRVRLTAATLLDARGAPALFAGIDIRMDEGWKTYWQSPGDGGGIPPEFDWSRSQNVRALTVRYPAPQRLKDAYGTSIGYITQVLFPVEVIPLDPARPVRLRLAMHFGVCDDICIPAEAMLALDVAPGARASVPVQRALSEALAAVPEAVALEALAVSLQNDAGGRHLMVTLGAEAPAVDRKSVV